MTSRIVAAFFPGKALARNGQAPVSPLWAGGAGAFAWAPSNTLSPEFLSIAGGLLIAVALLLMALHRRQPPPSTEPFLSPQENPAFITSIFQQCADRRVPLSIICTGRSLKSTSLTGILKLREDDPQGPLTVVLNDARHAESWIGAPVDVYFHFNEARGKTFYHFSTFIQSLEVVEDEPLLRLTRPSVLTNNQRREFVRVEPPTDMVDAITAWPLKCGSLPTLPALPRDLGRPPFAYRPPRVILMELVDISAGGLCLRVPVAQVCTKQVRCAPGTRFVVLLAVNSLQPNSARQLLWLAAVVRRAITNEAKTHVDMGMQFSHWALADALAAPIDWQPVALDGEVPFLLRWVSRVNSHLARLSG